MQILTKLLRSKKGKLLVVTLRCVWLFVTPWTVAHQAPLSMEFSRQQYWSALSCPSPGDRPHPAIEPWSPALQADSLPFFWATREALPAVGWGHKEGAGGDCGSDRLCTAALWGPLPTVLVQSQQWGKGAEGWGEEVQLALLGTSVLPTASDCPHLSIHSGYYSAIKKKHEVLPFAETQMDFKGIMLSEISQTEKDEYYLISLICEI